MIAGAKEVGDGGAGGQTTGKGQAVLGPVQRGEARLQHVPSGVPAPGVLVPLEQRGLDFELGTRQQCCDNVTMFKSTNWLINNVHYYYNRSGYFV